MCLYVCVCNLVLWWGTKTNKRNRDSCCAFTLAFKRARAKVKTGNGRRLATLQGQRLPTFWLIIHPCWLLDRRGGGGGRRELKKFQSKKLRFFLLVFHHILRGGLIFWRGGQWGYNGQLTLKREPLTKSTCGHWSVKGWSYIGIFHRDENPPMKTFGPRFHHGSVQLIVSAARSKTAQCYIVCLFFYGHTISRKIVGRDFSSLFWSLVGRVVVIFFSFHFCI